MTSSSLFGEMPSAGASTYRTVGEMLACFLRRTLAFGLGHEVGCVLHDRHLTNALILRRLWPSISDQSCKPIFFPLNGYLDLSRPRCLLPFRNFPFPRQRLLIQIRAFTSPAPDCTSESVRFLLLATIAAGNPEIYLTRPRLPLQIRRLNSSNHTCSSRPACCLGTDVAMVV
jgi:hypothetical protein